MWKQTMMAVAGLASGAMADGHMTADEPDYAVGMVQNWVRDFNQPFDQWGAKYKSDAYQEFLGQMVAQGVPHTTYTNIYYPTPKGSGVSANRAETSLPAPLPAAASGTPITWEDLFGDSAILAGMASQGYDGTPWQAYKDAPMANGSFPVVIMVHGLSGSVNTWASAAEYVAAQGYIVVTVALTSDSMAQPFAEDSDSPVSKLSNEEKQGIYMLRASETGGRVFSNFFKFLYGTDINIVSEADFPEVTTLTATEDGAYKATQQMSDLFEQRVADIARVITELKYLNENEGNCKAALERGSYTEALCGQFTGKIDVDHIGVMGHSLGSMTAQAAAAFYEDVDTAVGFNNGMPRMWEPWGGFPGDPVDGVPAGVGKPFLQIIGSDDDFIHMVFRQVHWQWFENAGGDPTQVWPLAAEQPWPTVENPQPVALSAYERATAKKMFVILRDEDHGTTTDDVAPHFTPGAELPGKRVPLSKDAQMAPYTMAGWVKEGDKDAFLPHVMRNYFLINWFDWTLKGDETARARLAAQPFDDAVQLMLEEGVSP